MGKLASIFVIARHIDNGLGALEILLQFGCGQGGVLLLDGGEILRGVLASLKTRRAEKNDRVLDLFTAEPGQWLLILREHAQDASIGAVEEWFVLIRNRSGFRCSVILNSSFRSLEARLAIAQMPT